MDKIAESIRREMLGKSITEEEYKKAMEQNGDGFSDEYEYIDNVKQWPDGSLAHYYYRVPRISEDELKLIIANRTCKAVEDTATHTKFLLYIAIGILVLNIIFAFL